MYFKQIEMTGFKSFPDRTVIRLEQGTTSIVGPNGCGKSNILDAMRWALGEQSAKALRGAHMQDVIFNGSENRHALGMAEVSLTFDNADSRLPVDFAEVQITRRVYRSGESEYLINKAPCRLKDIQELFMDTGIGTSAYSMIGQGKMDMVLSSKPEDRRFLFEEAAGIIKYKTRKRVAMRKLESADQNLLRLSDIIQEVERQMRSLKRQVNAAIRYRELSDELKATEIRSAWIKYVFLTAEITELRAKFAVAQDAYEKALAETTQFEARHEELGLNKLEIDRVLQARREGVYEIEGEMEKIERQIALLRQQIDFANEQRQQAGSEEEEYRQRAIAIEDQMKQTEARGVELQAGLEACQIELEARQQEHDAAAERVRESDAHVELMRARSVETISHRAKTQTELETLGVNIENIDAQLASIYERQREDSVRNEGLVTLLNDAQRTETEKQSLLADCEQRRTEAEADQAVRAQNLRDLNTEWQTLREKKSSLEARLRSLRELRDNYEGFAAGVRAVMAAKQKNVAEARGVVGPVGDLLSTEKTYERAIEAALGGNINNVVVEDADAAKSAISFLKKNNAGRVTFLPLDIIRASGNRDEGRELSGRPGVVGAAIDFVQYDAHIQNAVEYLLYNTLIVETLDVAIAIARTERRYPRLVTLDGEVVSSSGAVTGGRTQHDSRGLLGRSAEITELEEQVNTAEVGVARLADQGQALVVQIEELKRAIAEASLAQSTLQRELAGIRVEIAKHSTELNNLAQTAQSQDQQRDALCAKRDELEQQRREVLTRAGDMETDDETLQRQVAEAQDLASRARQELSLRTSELSDLRVRVAGLNQSVEEVQRDKVRELREQESAQREAQRRRELIEQLNGNQGTLENEIALNIERSKALSETKEEARGKVIEAENRRQTLLNDSDVVEKSLRELREAARASQSEVHRLELALRHSEDRVGFYQERILTEYGVALASLTAEQAGTDDYEEEQREKVVTDLRDKLQRMGTVNLMAIEEYEELEKRHAFLVAQDEDLRKAREALLSVVERIDKTIRQLFLDTFQAIAENFRLHFRRLFNGGHARIYLMDEDDPLESGIEIEAQPPGKKPQSISLLSGGESAMTAIALLFAIFKAKPSPFCVLDEVDAPLDDANIGRFLSLLEEFTSESQFVVITHSKQTMARANALYGVTQLERGVSQVVSVKFDEVRTADSAA
ncbi:MAG: chromosome segregation protein SMC [Candidatus Hydrogenedentes bacterium]|nr:chromosome segregation protein SMC [Candidatus Hydrogenedentota bacterium]